MALPIPWLIFSDNLRSLPMQKKAMAAWSRYRFSQSG
jgi:hypothetical protein